MPEPRIVQAINKFRASLLAAEAQSAERLVIAYGRIYQNLNEKIRALEADIADLENATLGKVVRLERYKELIQQTAEQMDRYAVILDNEVAVLRRKAITDATAQSKQLVQAALPSLPPQVQAQLVAGFNRLPVEAVEAMLGALQKDSPLNDLLNEYGNKAALDIGNTILDGVALGYNPRKVAAQIQQAMGNNLTRALTVSRTETMRAYRTASLGNYAANSDVVKGWKWMVTKKISPPPCLACLALDGRQFGTNELFMKAHPN
jgi:hypothetical protein